MADLGIDIVEHRNQPATSNGRASVSPKRRPMTMEPDNESIALQSIPSPDIQSATSPPLTPLFLSPALEPKSASRGSVSQASVTSQRSSRFNIIIWKARELHVWNAPILMVFFFVVGLGMSLAHCIFYTSLNRQIVGNSNQQEEKLRVGTALAFLTQLALTASVWKSCTQWLWRAVYGHSWTAKGLNKAFGADTAPSSILSRELFRNFKLGAVMAILAWCLILPPFFTPAALYVYPSTQMVNNSEPVPYVAIANSSAGHQFAYSPPKNTDDTPDHMRDTTRIFTGPRTVLTLLSSATASSGEILPIAAPSNHSSYSINFFGPLVRCEDANGTVAPIIDRLLNEHKSVRKGTARQVDNAYFGFVPSVNNEGEIIALSQPRYQGPSMAINELWMTFQRWSVNSSGDRVRTRSSQVCRLYNATYDLDLQWDLNVQNVTGQATVHEEVAFPRDVPNTVSHMERHAYAAFMWTLTDQLVGSLGWFKEDENQTNSLVKVPQFGALESPLQHTSLLGSVDLDIFFDFRSLYDLYVNNDDKDMTGQRLQDKNLARNQTLAVLIEELSFNMTVSLLHNQLLTANTTRVVTRWTDVNRYGYVPTSLIIPYALANLVALAAVVLGLVSFLKDGTYPDKTFQDIANAAGDPHIIKIIKDAGPGSSAANELSIIKQGTVYAVRRPSVSPSPIGTAP